MVSYPVGTLLFLLFFAASYQPVTSRTPRNSWAADSFARRRTAI